MSKELVASNPRESASGSEGSRDEGNDRADWRNEVACRSDKSSESLPCSDPTGLGEEVYSLLIRLDFRLRVLCRRLSQGGISQSPSYRKSFDSLGPPMIPLPFVLDP